MCDEPLNLESIIGLSCNSTFGTDIVQNVELVPNRYTERQTYPFYLRCLVQNYKTSIDYFGKESPVVLLFDKKIVEHRGQFYYCTYVYPVGSIFLELL